uniref:Methyltransferase FkbM domain-containing protein n=1 Tax=viral metagenome TaxID=1070528 RepID=A0A6C0JLS8_9ZZZZ
MSITEILKVYHFDKKRRFGNKEDGGYVIGELNELYDCYISAGIFNEESFSRDFINEYKMNEYNSYGFDGTINGYPYNYTNRISFIKKNIGDIENDTHTNLSFLINKYNNIFLKIDIEGGEYPWLLNISEDQLKKFKQIVIEFHGITNDGWGCINSDKMKCLTKLNNTHYIIHAHGNNYGPTHNNMPDVIELTYVNKTYFDVVPNLNKASLPFPNLDFPNAPSRPEINLNMYPFVHS